MEAVHKAALALGTANQLTNILRDVGEDALERNRIYVPLEELDQFGISESEASSVHGRTSEPLAEGSANWQNSWQKPALCYLSWESWQSASSHKLQFCRGLRSM